MCDTCGKELPANPKYESWTASYYRNKTSGKYYFCSENCMNEFNKTRKCHFCSYYGDLVETENGYMACTSDEHWKYSCLDKYQIRKKFNLDQDINIDDEECDYVKQNNCLPKILREYINHDDTNISVSVVQYHDILNRLHVLENEINVIKNKIDNI